MSFQDYPIPIPSYPFFHEAKRSLKDRISRLRMGQRPGVSTLQENIKELRAGTWEAVNGLLVRYAEAQRIEKGRKVRLDSTAVESNIHYPTDSRLLEERKGVWATARIGLTLYFLERLQHRVSGKNRPGWREVRSRQMEASRLRKPLARLTTEGVTHVLSEKGA